MFKNKLVVSVRSEKSKLLRKEVGWVDQCKLTELQCKYIPRELKEIVPIDEFNYLMRWENKQSFDNFIEEPNYIYVVKVLHNYDIFVEFADL